MDASGTTIKQPKTQPNNQPNKQRNTAITGRTAAIGFSGLRITKRGHKKRANDKNISHGNRVSQSEINTIKERIPEGL